MTSSVQAPIRSDQRERIQLTIRGTVQGIGFRPFAFRLAQDLSLGGWIANTPQGTLLELEGTPKNLQTFQKRITAELPLTGNIQAMTSTHIPVIGQRSFCIHPSQGDDQAHSVISPDLATCEDCLQDIKSPKSRRYRYPFTTCAQCGPRFSIALRLPYDRLNTTMDQFVICEECQCEYDDPSDRRFHAETIACPSCGPQVELWDHDGKLLAQQEEGLQAAAEIIRHGSILAVKGLGGFQLWVKADSSEAIQRLRQRKLRPTKPMAVLFHSLASLDQHCLVSPDETALLTSPAAPIVLVRKRATSTLAHNVSPNNSYVGAMLPHTPLHHLLANELLMPVIATSGNRSGEPLVIDEQDAVHRLHRIADAFLVHNRPIVRPVDDSIVQVVNEKCQMRRRARGYVPTPLSVELGLAAARELLPILAVGGHLKNTVAVTTADQIIVSQHIGDLSTPEASTQFEQTIADMLTLFAVTPQAIACDSHPDYRSSRLAHQFGQRHHIPVLPIQHHHAHIAACQAEHGLQGPVLGVAWDGAGYGSDETIWGGEFFLCEDAGFRRMFHVRPFGLPGGEVCMREPRRVALALLNEVFGKDVLEWDLPPLQSLGSPLSRSLVALLEKDVHCPITSSVGRLFDGVSALLGLSQIASFEGEAAMALEFLADSEIEHTHLQPYRIPIEPQSESQGPWVADWRPLLAAIVQDIFEHKSPSTIALGFHHALAMLIADVAERIQCPQIVLSGGVFQNALLLKFSEGELTKRGFTVFTPHLFGPNDGGLSLGQAVIARNQFGL
ncbi:MAG: carbamoyltransferase HypF [Nitrospirota bacterium]|nr:carbamoyltransferase HypF [Nitrospirota bacterium]MDH5586035.1 carbamoyltransferase HypF [Nitrospirota bacterium]MDH5773318.1 carbamoyltransferase HypF [Nitrospirota bacterium]